MHGPTMLTARLQRFRLNGIRDTGIDIGRGSYAVVKEFYFRGLKCVGKEIHSLLYEEAAPEERADMLRRFEDECELLSRLHHPNVVQFLGIHVGGSSGLPALVMEYLPATLSACVDRHGVLPADICLGILLDVALGLCYLHEDSPPIIHRDLSANNVLLTTSMSAKISDLGVAKILDMSPARAALMTQTQVPGTPSYMPPETMVDRPKYTSKVDIFSMGVLIVHVLSGEWPIPSEAFTEDPLNPDNFIGVSEFDRRCRKIEKIEDGHPLLSLIRQCLSNIPSHRPDAVEVVHQVREAYSQVSPSPENRLELFQQVQSLRIELQQRSREENEALTRENEALQSERRQYSSRVAALQMELSIKTQEIDTLRMALQDERRQNDSRISSLRAEVERMRSALTSIQDGSRTENEIQRLLVHQSSESPTGLRSHTKLQWKRGTDASEGIRMVETQAVVIEERVYVRGLGNKVHQYDWTRNVWSTLPKCLLWGFGMAQFLGQLITVGGVDMQSSVSGKVYQFSTNKWEESLLPMPTARYALTVITTTGNSSKPPSIVACGGSDVHHQAVNTVEVYCHASSQWYTAKPLPTPCWWMTSVTIDNTCYILEGSNYTYRGTNCCFSVSLDSLIDDATSPCSQLDDPIWISVSDTPLTHSTAASLRGSLIAVGGRDISTDTTSSAIHILTSNGSWERMREGDLPEPRYGCAAVCLPTGELLVAGGSGNDSGLKRTVVIASIVN